MSLSSSSSSSRSPNTVSSASLDFRGFSVAGAGTVNNKSSFDVMDVILVVRIFPVSSWWSNFSNLIATVVSVFMAYFKVRVGLEWSVCRFRFVFFIGSSSSGKYLESSVVGIYLALVLVVHAPRDASTVACAVLCGCVWFLLLSARSEYRTISTMVPGRI